MNPESVTCTPENSSCIHFLLTCAMMCTLNVDLYMYSWNWHSMQWQFRLKDYTQINHRIYKNYAWSAILVQFVWTWLKNSFSELSQAIHHQLLLVMIEFDSHNCVVVISQICVTHLTNHYQWNTRWLPWQHLKHYFIPILQQRPGNCAPIKNPDWIWQWAF